MPAGFASPDVLFAGNSAAPERRFYRHVLGGLREAGYTRYVEVGAGSFAAALVALDAGWEPAQMETSDVTLYSSIVGTMLSGGDLAALGIALDGEPIQLPDADLATQAAFLLWAQLRARMEARPDAAYWRNVVVDLTERAVEHQAAIRKQLTQLQARLGGISYRPLDMWEHITEAAGDPHCVILAAPPTYKSGFEKFFDTGGRLGWAEPRYDVFDPDTGFRRLAEMMTGVPALLLCLQEGLTRQAAAPAVFARPNGPGRTCYVITNRPDDVFAITGGPKVLPRSPADVASAGLPPLPLDWEPGKDSKAEVYPVKGNVADYYRGLWMHRLAATPGSYNMLVAVDGFAAGILGYSADPMIRPYSMESRWVRHILLRFAFGAPHRELRMTRLATMLALQRHVCEAALGTGAAIYLAASEGLITVEMTRFPEAKGLRGLMKLANKQPHPDGFKLTYAAPWSKKPNDDVLREFLAKEAKWRATRARISRQ
jgi:hypothetical protein